MAINSVEYYDIVICALFRQSVSYHNLLKKESNSGVSVDLPGDAVSAGLKDRSENLIFWSPFRYGKVFSFTGNIDTGNLRQMFPGTPHPIG